MIKQLKFSCKLIITLMVLTLSILGNNVTHVQAKQNDVNLKINNLTVSNKVVNAGGTVKFQFDYSSDLDISSEFERIAIILKMPLSGNTKVIYATNLQGSSYEATYNTAIDNEDGVYKISAICFLDSKSNIIYSINNNTVPPAISGQDFSGADFSIQNSQGADFTPPVFNSISTDSKTYYLGMDIEYTMDAEDDVSGIETIILKLSSPSGKIVTASAHYSKNDKEYKIQVNNSDLNEQGTWKVHQILFKDFKENMSSYSNNSSLDLSYANVTITEDPNVDLSLKNVTLYDKSLSSSDSLNAITYNGDVYIGPNAIISMKDCTINGNLYVFGVAKLANIKVTGNIYASQFYFSGSSNTQGSVNLSGTNSVGSFITSNPPIDKIPVDLYHTINVSSTGYANISGALLPIGSYKLNGSPISYDYKGRFYLENIDVKDADSVTLEWTNAPFPASTRKIQVTQEKPTKLEIVKKPNKLEYTYGEILSLDGMEVKATYADGASRKISNYKVEGSLDKIGTNTITISYQGTRVELPITVKEILADTITLSSNSETLYTSNKIQLTAKISPDNVTNKKITWASENQAIAKVDSNGLVTAVSPGETYIYAQTSNSLKEKCKITVYAYSTSIAISSKDTIFYANESYSFKARVLPTTAEQKVTWRTGNEAIATVDKNGVVTTRSIGNTYLYAKTEDGLEKRYLLKVLQPMPRTITFDKVEDYLIMQKGNTESVHVNITPSNANQSVKYRTGNSAVATIDKNGDIKAVSEGNTYVYATASNGLETKCLLKVIPVTQAFDINYKNKSIEIGSSFQFIATTKPSSIAQYAKWEIKDTKIATVDKNGLVTAVSEGTTYLYVSIPNHTVLKCEIKVVPETIKSLSIEYDTKNIEIGNTFKFTAKTNPASFASSITWKTGNSAIATVDKDGLVTPVSIGNTYLYASAPNGMQVKCLIKIVNPTLKNFSIGFASKDIVIGEKFKFNATTDPAYVATYIKWRTGNNAVAKVDSKGNITTVAVGNTYVYATAPNGQEIKCLLRVLQSNINISIGYSTKNIQIYDSFQFTVVTDPISAIKDVTWRIGNSAIAKVDKNGLVTPVSVGNTYLYAKVANGMEVKCLIKITA